MSCIDNPVMRVALRSIFSEHLLHMKTASLCFARNSSNASFWMGILDKSDLISKKIILPFCWQIAQSTRSFVMLHFTSTAYNQSTHAGIKITYSKPQLFCSHPILIPHEVIKYIDSAFSQIILPLYQPRLLWQLY